MDFDEKITAMMRERTLALPPVELLPGVYVRSRRHRRRRATAAVAVSAAVFLVAVPLLMRLNSDFGPSRGQTLASSREPDLGTIAPSAQLADTLKYYGGPAQRPVAKAGRLDVLARAATKTGTFTTVGQQRADGVRCVSGYGQTPMGFVGLGGYCQSNQDFTPAKDGLVVERSFDPSQQLIFGRTMPGARTVTLTSGAAKVTVRVTSGGYRWSGAGFFIAPWAASGTTLVTAYDTQGTRIGQVSAPALRGP